MKGNWGGQSIALDVADDGARVEFDCAHGTIQEKIVPDQNGKFSVKGSFVREHGGPTRENEDMKGKPAIYAGTVEGGTMTLTITISETNEAVGTFTLTHGKTGRIRKCG